MVPRPPKEAASRPRAGSPRATRATDAAGEQSATHPFARAFARRFDPAAFEARLRTLRSRPPYRLPAAAVPHSFARSSVLILFWRELEDLRVLLTLRADSLRGHPGQMSFPGGRLESGEEWIGAALRETEEEVGIPPDEIEVLGRLDDAWSGAGFVLAPVVGWLATRPSCRPNPEEVAEVHTPSVRALVEPEVYSAEQADLGGDLYTNATLRWPGGRVFGLSTDLLIEAIQWGLGIETGHGPSRRESLRSFLRYKNLHATGSSARGRVGGAG